MAQSIIFFISSEGDLDIGERDTPILSCLIAKQHLIRTTMCIGVIKHTMNVEISAQHMSKINIIYIILSLKEGGGFMDMPLQQPLKKQS